MPKASSVTVEGTPDGFVPPLGFRAEVTPDGATRLLVSAPPERLAELHRALVEVLGGPLGVLYVQLTDRQRGLQHPKPLRWLSLEQPAARVRDVLDRCQRLLYADARHQLWLRGPMREQLVLDELGLIWVYPDDFAFRDRLEALGVPPLGRAPTMAERDYVRVELLPEADPEETWLLRGLSMQTAAG